MQICNCTVAIGGDPGMTVFKERVTVPELMVLQAVHGDDAVRHIEVIADETVNSNEERERLSFIYKTPEGVVKATLGAVGALPKTLDESGIAEDFIVSNTARKTSAAKKKASATEEMTIPAEE